MKRPPDMSRAEFNAALKRRGWRQVLLWIDTGNGHSIGMVMINGKVNRRASLAHAIRESEKVYIHVCPVCRRPRNACGHLLEVTP